MHDGTRVEAGIFYDFHAVWIGHIRIAFNSGLLPRGSYAFAEQQVAAGAPLPEMPLFPRSDRYIGVPLEATYQAAYHGMPEFWREVLEGRRPGRG